MSLILEENALNELIVEAEIVESENDSIIVMQGSVDVESIEPEVKVTVQKKSFTIVDDNLFIADYLSRDDAPTWLKNLINFSVDTQIDGKNIELLDNISILINNLAGTYVPENQYTQAIANLSNENQNALTLITALDSTFRDELTYANSKIINLESTKASLTEVDTRAMTVLNAELNRDGSSIKTVIGNLNQAIATETYSRGIQYNGLVSSINDLDEGIVANASATSSLYTYVGYDENGGDTGTGLLASVKILQKQADGVIEVTTGTYDVMSGIEDPNINTDNDGLITTAKPYADWIPRSGNVNPTGSDLQYRLYKNNLTNKYFMYTGTSWSEISLEEYTANEEMLRSIHVGDVYIMYSSSNEGYKTYVRAYKFIKTAIDATSPYATDDKGYTWSVIVDTDAQNAYVAALNAFDLADSKRRVFVATPTVPYDVGDLWTVQSGASIIGTTQGGRIIQAGDLLRCLESKTISGLYEHNDWVPADNYRESMNAIQTDLNNWRTGAYATFVSGIQSQVDLKAETFYQSTVPTGRLTRTNVAIDATLDKYVGDLWKNTYSGTISGYLGNNTEYVYTKTANGSNWNYGWTKMEVPDIVFDTIDTKKSIYSGNSVPVAVYPDVIETNDMWITGSSPVSGYDKESIYVWNGLAWVKPLKYTDDTAVVALSTGLANGTTTIKLSNAYVGTTPLTTYINSEIDGKVGVYSGTTAPVAGQPSGVAINDIYLWFTTANKTLANGTVQTYDVTKTYKYSGSAWTEVTTNSNITALADLADGKRTIFSNSGASTPVGVNRDMWIPSASGNGYVAGEIYLHNGTNWILATKYSADIAALTSNVQSQIDGKVDTYYQATVPFANATNVARKTSAGDYWYCTATSGGYTKGKMYKYVETANGSNWNYTWTETADVTKYAFDKADSKAAIYTTANKPNTYNARDMLIVLTDNAVGTYSAGVVLTAIATRTSGSFTDSEWEKQINDTEDLDAFINEVNPKIATLENQIDGTIEYFYYEGTGAENEASTLAAKLATWSTQDLKEQHNGDVVYFKDTTNGYWYSSKLNTWQAISDTSMLKALKVAENAKATADGVVVSFYAVEQTSSTGIDTAKFKYWYNGTTLSFYNGSSWSAKTGLHIGDTLTTYVTDTKDTKVYIYSGTLWYTQSANGIVASSKAITDLNSRMTTTEGTVGAHTTQLSTVDTRISAEGTRVESKWQYNSEIKIGDYTYNTGFGLATSATAGSGLINGESEFWIKADKFKLMSADGSKKSSYIPFSVDTTTGDISFNGKVSFSNVNNAPSVSSNLLYNSEPSLQGVTKGYVLGYNDTGLSAHLGQHTTDWAPSGSASIFINNTGTPASDRVFDINSEKRIPIVGGKTYCAYAYFGAHRCTAQLIIGFYDSSGSIISYSLGNDVVNLIGGTLLSGYGQSVIKVVAPSNAASVLMIYRGKNTTGANPYVFVVRSYLGVIDSVESLAPEWSEGVSVVYTSSSVVNDINNGNTTTINGGRLATGSVTANQINTSGLGADFINANEIIGKNISGGTISGTIIEGSIIKASYIDLNGQLKVLTDYIVSVAMYNANPSLYTDAVYIGATNVYRIPTLSVVKEALNVYQTSSVSNYYGSIYSYATGNSGTLLKAQLIRPVFQYGNITLINSVSWRPWWFNYNYVLVNWFRLKLNGTVLFECKVEYESRPGGTDGNLEFSRTYISGVMFNPITVYTSSYEPSTRNYNLDIGIANALVSHSIVNRGSAGYGWDYLHNTEVSVSLSSGSKTLPFDWTSGNLVYEQVMNANGINEFTFNTIQITNLAL